MKIIHRYLLREYITQFAFCTLGFLVIYIGELIFELNHILVGKRTPMSVVFLLIYYRIPYLLMDIFPAAALFGIYLSMGRFSKDRELDVLRTCGLSFPRLVYPLVIVTFLLCIGIYCFNDYVVPMANHRYWQEYKRLMYKDALPFIEENKFIKGPDDRFFYIKMVNVAKKRLEGIMVYELTRKYPRLITASFGWIDKEEWLLKEGVIHELDNEGYVEKEYGFEELTINTGEDLTAFLSESRGTDEMTRAELKEQMELYGRSGFDVALFEVDYHLKVAIPFASLVLAVLALPFSCLMPRSGRVLGMGFSLFFIFSYYFSQVIFRTLGINNVILPFWAAWIPNLIYLFLGGFLIDRVIR